MKVCYCKGNFVDIIVNNISYLKCPNCGYLRKTKIESLEEQKKRYDYHICDEGYLKYMENVFKEVSKYLNDGLSLDFGCGKIHALSDILNKNGYECKYYDLFYYPELPLEKFNNIIMIEVFEHLNDPFKELKKLQKQLLPGGKIIIKTKPYPINIDNWWYLRDITHVSFIKEETMRVWANILNMDFYCEKDIFIFVCI